VLGRAITALGVTQIVGWGTTYYSTAVLFAPMARDTGWSATLIYGAFSWAMLLQGLVSRRVGEWVERRGERQVMTIGSLGIAAGLAALALANHPAVLFAAWTLLGLAMRMALYESAFSALARIEPPRARRSISLLTLYGGLASTAFWPLGHWASAQWGWRGALLLYAVLNLLVCVPLHRWALPRHPAPRAPTPGPQDAASQALARGRLSGRDRERALAVLAGLLAAHGFVFSCLSAHVLEVLQALGLAAATAVSIAAMKGVAQVVARFLELSLQRFIPPAVIGLLATGGLPLGLLLMALGAPEVAWVGLGCVVYGAANGLITIVRGTLSLQLFGHAGYAVTLARLAAPGMIVSALAPMAYAMVVERLGHRPALWLLSAVAMAGLAGMGWLIRLSR